MEGDTPNSLARGNYRLMSLQHPPAYADRGTDVVQLHMAAEQDTDDSEYLPKEPPPRRGNADKSKNVKDISSDFRIAASGPFPTICVVP